MKKNHPLLLIAASARIANSFTADSSLNSRFNLSYRHLNDSFSQPLKNAPGAVSEFRDLTDPP